MRISQPKARDLAINELLSVEATEGKQDRKGKETPGTERTSDFLLHSTLIPLNSWINHFMLRVYFPQRATVLSAIGDDLNIPAMIRISILQGALRPFPSPAEPLSTHSPRMNIPLNIYFRFWLLTPDVATRRPPALPSARTARSTKPLR